MFINPITKIDTITGVGAIGQVGTPKATDQSMFKDIFSDALQNVVQTDQAVANDVYALSTGQSDDLHSLLINQTKAQLAVDMMVQLRNKVMDAYSELMRINL